MGEHAMKARQIELLKRLLTAQDMPLIVEQIAANANYSEKTIRNDLHAIEAYLQSWSTAKLARKPGVGVYLRIGETVRQQLYEVMFQVNHVSDEERLLE